MGLKGLLYIYFFKSFFNSDNINYDIIVLFYHDPKHHLHHYDDDDDDDDGGGELSQQPLPSSTLSLFLFHTNDRTNDFAQVNAGSRPIAAAALKKYGSVSLTWPAHSCM